MANTPSATFFCIFLFRPDEREILFNREYNGEIFCLARRTDINHRSWNNGPEKAVSSG